MRATKDSGCALRRYGFTLIELLVVIALIAIGLGLALPAAQQAREAARRAQCAARMKQLVLAVHHFETTHGYLPPWTVGKAVSRGRVNYCSLQSLILPYLELSSLHDSINFDVHCRDPGDLTGDNMTAARTIVEAFLCPTDGLSHHTTSSNYRANLGTWNYRISRTPADRELVVLEETGAFVVQGKLTQADFTDGTSNTLAFSEKLVGSNNPSRYSPRRDWLVSREPPSDEKDGWERKCSSIGGAREPQWQGGRFWILGGAAYTAFFPIATPNSEIPDCGTRGSNGNGLFTARSLHPGGVNATLMDSSVRWFSNSTDRRHWRSLGTRNTAD